MSLVNTLDTGTQDDPAISVEADSPLNSAVVEPELQRWTATIDQPEAGPFAAGVGQLVQQCL
jgi:hypothetical protein